MSTLFSPVSTSLRHRLTTIEAEAEAEAAGLRSAIALQGKPFFQRATHGTSAPTSRENREYSCPLSAASRFIRVSVKGFGLRTTRDFASLPNRLLSQDLQT